MTINMKRVSGGTEIAVAECIDKRFGTWRVRTDFKPVYGEDGESQTGVTFIEHEFPYKPTMAEVKEFVLGVIDQQTQAEIIGGFTWNDKPVWLSADNQRNFAVDERRAQSDESFLPRTIKLGEDADGNGVYHTFKKTETLTAFWNACQDYIYDCRKAGWQKKDSFDFSPYEEVLGGMAI